MSPEYGTRSVSQMLRIFGIILRRLAPDRFMNLIVLLRVRGEWLRFYVWGEGFGEIHNNKHITNSGNLVIII